MTEHEHEADGLHSTYHKQLAAIASEREAAEKETAESQAESAHLRRYSAHLERMTRIPDAVGREEYLRSQEEATDASERDLVTRQRDLTAQLLAAKHGVPLAELENYTDLKDMKIAAMEMEWELYIQRSNGTEPED